MKKVTLTLESEDLGADDLEDILESFRPILNYMSIAKVTIKVEEE